MMYGGNRPMRGGQDRSEHQGEQQEEYHRPLRGHRGRGRGMRGGRGDFNPNEMRGNNGEPPRELNVHRRPTRGGINQEDQERD
jgi:hypothetical protein